MRTLHIDLGREMAGGQWQVIYLLERLTEARLIARETSPLFRAARERDIDVRPVGEMMAGFAWADVVHAHDARAHTCATLCMAGRRPRPLVVSRRVGFPVRKSFFSRWKYSRADAYLAVSRFVSQRLAEAGIAPGRVFLVYDGVPIPDKTTSGEGGAIAIAGKCEELVRAAGKTAGVPIRFTANLWRDLSSARVLIYASEMEGLGSAALAAMAFGVPVIATPAGGLPEIVEHERTGLLADAAGIAEALRRLLDDPAEASRMGRQGRELAKEKFSVDQMVERTKNVYQGVLRG